MKSKSCHALEKKNNNRTSRSILVIFKIRAGISSDKLHKMMLILERPRGKELLPLFLCNFSTLTFSSCRELFRGGESRDSGRSHRACKMWREFNVREEMLARDRTVE